MSKKLTTIFIVILTLISTTCGCTASKKTELPEDYSFSLIWGVNGISYYDSATGKLVKTNDATKPEDYITTHTLSEEEQKEIRELLSGLDLDSYPNEYDPYNNPNSNKRVMTSPSQDIVLTVNLGEEIVEIKCIDIALSHGNYGYNGAARDFLAVVERIEEILVTTDEWQALPEYEFLYE